MGKSPTLQQQRRYLDPLYRYTTVWSTETFGILQNASSGTIPSQVLFHSLILSIPFFIKLNGRSILTQHLSTCLTGSKKYSRQQVLILSFLSIYTGSFTSCQYPDIHCFNCTSCIDSTPVSSMSGSASRSLSLQLVVPTHYGSHLLFTFHNIVENSGQDTMESIQRELQTVWSRKAVVAPTLWRRIMFNTRLNLATVSPVNHIQPPVRWFLSNHGSRSQTPRMAPASSKRHRVSS